MLCANAARSVDDFLEYDLIGAPIEKKFGQGYNGGLSMRSRSVILRVLDEWKYSDDPHPAEDQWFYARWVVSLLFCIRGGYGRFSGGESRANGHANHRFKDLRNREVEEGIEDGINLPSMEIARTFAVETIDHPHPLGNYSVPFLFLSLLFSFLSHSLSNSFVALSLIKQVYKPN